MGLFIFASRYMVEKILAPSWRGFNLVAVPGRARYRTGTTVIRCPCLTASTAISVSISNPDSLRVICRMEGRVKAR
ncbi:MAG: hypothetical protein BWX50_01694 [Euryarchaeota archaeon ADurb.Bin009]|nr:MAG: hypothetical protein BWX50_01694 [Euryarchaeota archaeon ADurb.Bin009]